MIKFHFISSIDKLRKALDLFAHVKFTPEAKEIFSDLAEVCGNSSGDILLFDNKGNCLIALKDQLEIYYRYLFNKCVESRSASAAAELWNIYSHKLSFEEKIQLVHISDGVIKSSSFLKLSYDIIDEDYSNHVVFANSYDNLTIQHTTFENSHITNTSFAHAYLRDVDFSDCVFENVNFNGTTFGPGVNFSGAKFINTEVCST